MKTFSSRRRSTSLHADCRGAIMVMAVFMAIIAIAALYYLVGLGEAMVAKEQMQDAADSAAFSSAVLHARGMNLLAMINLIMASLLAILIMLAMLASLLDLGAKILLALSFLLPTGPGVPPLRAGAQAARTAERSARPVVESSLRALHRLQGPLSRAVPLLAAANAADIASNHYRPVVHGGVSFPVLSGLPTVPGSYARLCDKAGRLAGKILIFPLSAVLENIPFGDRLAGKLQDLSSDLGSAYSGLYCGTGNSLPPKVTVEEGLPGLNTPERVSCEESRGEDLAGESDVCTRYQAKVDAAQEAYSIAQGKCRPEAEGFSECEQIRRRARVMCNPLATKVKKVTWRESKYTRVFERVQGEDGDIVEERPRRTRTFNRISGAKPPCIQETQFESLTSPSTGDMRGWNFSIDAPVCKTPEEKPSLAFMKEQGLRRLEIHGEEVTDVLSCVISKELDLELAGESLESFQDFTPREMCNRAQPGAELFQVRSIVVGDPDSRTHTADNGVAIGLGRSADPGDDTLLRRLGSAFALGAAAQAEFYFDGTEAPAEWLWSMKWKARLRRLRLPGADGAPTSASSAHAANNCPTSAIIDAVDAPLRGLNKVLVH